MERLNELKSALLRNKGVLLTAAGALTAAELLTGCNPFAARPGEALRATTTPVTSPQPGTGSEAATRGVQQAVGTITAGNKAENVPSAPTAGNPESRPAAAPANQPAAAGKAESRPATTEQQPAARPETQQQGAAQQERQSTLDVRFPGPRDFRPEVPGGMQNTLLENAKQGSWFHPMTRIRFLGNQEHVWSYDYYYAFRGDMELVQHAGEEGRLIFRQETGPSRLVVGVGRLDTFTDNSGRTQDLTGNITGGQPSTWIRTHPFVEVRVFNPDTGESLKDANGQEIRGVTSESGDIGFGLSNCGRIVLAMEVPFDPKLETFVWEGPHDRVQDDVNWIDVSNAMACVRAGATAPSQAPSK